MPDRTIPSARGAVARTDNNPPGPIEAAKEAYSELAAFLKETPIIQTAEEAKDAHAWIERTRISLQDARADRDKQTAPLNAALRKIRSAFDLVREKSANNRGGALQVAYDEVKRRLLAYMDEEKRRRDADAAVARQAAAEAERIAREAERQEQDAIACADVGECTDVGAAIQQADAAFAEFQRANRAAAIAERDATVRISSVMGNRAITAGRIAPTLRKLVVIDAIAAVRALGPTDDICAALVKAAKAYEAAHGELPAGIAETYERSM